MTTAGVLEGFNAARRAGSRRRRPCGRSDRGVVRGLRKVTPIGDASNGGSRRKRSLHDPELWCRGSHDTLGTPSSQRTVHTRPHTTLPSATWYAPGAGIGADHRFRARKRSSAVTTAASAVSPTVTRSIAMKVSSATSRITGSQGYHEPGLGDAVVAGAKRGFSCCAGCGSIRLSRSRVLVRRLSAPGAQARPPHAPTPAQIAVVTSEHAHVALIARFRRARARARVLRKSVVTSYWSEQPSWSAHSAASRLLHSVAVPRQTMSMGVQLHPETAVHVA